MVYDPRSRLELESTVEPTESHFSVLAPVNWAWALRSALARPLSRLASDRCNLSTPLGAAEFCPTDPTRLKGITMINLDDVQEGTGSWSAPPGSASPVR